MSYDMTRTRTYRSIQRREKPIMISIFGEKSLKSMIRYGSTTLVLSSIREAALMMGQSKYGSGVFLKHINIDL